MLEWIKRTVRGLRHWLADYLEPDGFLRTAEAEPWRIADGVSYALPVVVPLRIAEMGQEAVEAFIRESYPQYKTQWGDPYLQGEPFNMLDISTPLRPWDHATRVAVLEQCHLAWERNPLANAAITFNRLFAVQNGMRRSYRNSQVRAAIEAFCANPENDVESQEKELLDTLQVDGELFLEFHQGDGQNGATDEVIMTSIPAWGIRAIETELGFVRRPVAYHPAYSQDTGAGTGGADYRSEPIPAERVLHVIINKLSYEQRGRPELLKVLPYLGGYREWLENRGRQNHYRGTVVYDVTLNNATPAQVSAKRGQYKEPPRGVSIAVHNQNETWQVLEGKVNASDAAEDGRQMKLQVAAGMRQPEYMLSDGANANLASATAQQLPALRSFAEWQDVMVYLWRRVFWRVLTAAGLDLDAEIEEEDSQGNALGRKMKVRDAFEVKYAELESTDPKNIAEALAIAVGERWMSNETAAGTLPFDLNYEEEQRKIQAELERERDLVGMGLMPDPMMQMVPSGQMNPSGNQPFSPNGAGGESEDDDGEG